MNKLIELYQKILRIRLIEEEIAKRYSEQKMRCPTHLSIGQEAVAVGVSDCLTISDKVYSSHRAHAHYLAKGGDLNKLIAELYGKSNGCTAGRGGSMHLTDLKCGFMASTAIVANSIPLAVGNALHQQVMNKNDISVAYFGDGATEEGAFYESANFAVVKQLPVLFICENNQYSVYTNLKPRQPQYRSITELSKAIGLNSLSVDGNDVEAVRASVKKLIGDIKSGKGPAFIECSTYRHREHCGPNFDDSLGYRLKSEVESWLDKDPVKLIDQKLKNTPNWQEQKQQLFTDIQQEIEQAFNLAELSSFDLPERNEGYLYAE